MLNKFPVVVVKLEFLYVLSIVILIFYVMIMYCYSLLMSIAMLEKISCECMTLQLLSSH